MVSTGPCDLRRLNLGHMEVCTLMSLSSVTILTRGGSLAGVRKDSGDFRSTSTVHNPAIGDGGCSIKAHSL